MEHILKPLPRILQFPETLGKNLYKILTKSAKNMFDLARSCQELQEKYLFFLTEKTHKKGFWYKKTDEKPRILSRKRNPRNSTNPVMKYKKIQEMPRILVTIPGKPKNKREKVRYYWMIMNEIA